MKDDEANLICVGNVVVINDKLQTKQNIRQTLEGDYRAWINDANMSDVKFVTDEINDYVSNLTRERINDLVTPSIVADTVIMILNAIYFDGHWKVPFDTTKTMRASFTTATKQPIYTDFMTDIGSYYYLDSKKLNAKLLRIPYAGRKYAMFVILPNPGETVSSIASLLNHVTINREAWYMDEHTIDLKLPKFNINYSADLKPYLKGLGINSIFSSDADFSNFIRGRSANMNQIVSSVLQKAAIDVNEEGSSAAAATELQLVNKINEGRREFHANRPFLFYIEDETTGNIIFAGQVSDPSQKS